MKGRIKKEVYPLDCGRYHGCLYEPRFGMPFHITQQGLSPPAKHVYSACMLCSQLVFSEYRRQVLQAGCSVLGLLSAVGE